jgi:hypothetical protein
MTKQNSDACQGAPSAEPDLPTEVFARVLGKLGVQIDPSTEDGRLRIATFVSAALSDPAMTERILQPSTTAWICHQLMLVLKGTFRLRHDLCRLCDLAIERPPMNS